MKFTCIIILIITFSVSCKTSKTTSLSTKDDNNVISITKKGINVKSKKGADEIIFEGKNNLIDIVKKNTAFFDKKHDVIVIKGDNNIVKIYNINIINIIDMSGYGKDTLVLVGNNQKYVMLYDNEVVFKNKNVQVEYEYVKIKTSAIDFTKINNEIKPDDICWETIKNYEKEIQKGHSLAYYKLSEMYNYGLEGTPLSTKKAIELYEYGAINNEIQSIQRLADIWYNGAFDIEADKIKGIYYYKLGAQIGDSYCQNVLDNI